MPVDRHGRECVARVVVAELPRAALAPAPDAGARVVVAEARVTRNRTTATPRRSSPSTCSATRALRHGRIAVAELRRTYCRPSTRPWRSRRCRRWRTRTSRRRRSRSPHPEDLAPRRGWRSPRRGSSGRRRAAPYESSPQHETLPSVRRAHAWMSNRGDRGGLLALKIDLHSGEAARPSLPFPSTPDAPLPAQ